jgi:hypothetical protein
MVVIACQYVAGIRPEMHGRGEWSFEMRRHQITVPLDPKLRELVERAAEREDRTVANYVRHLIAQAVRNAGRSEQQAA